MAYSRPASFWGQVNKRGPKQPHMPTRCWTWTGPHNGHGYGVWTYKSKRWYVHRWVWTTYKGLIPPKYEVDHLCFHRPCVRPSHLEAVTKLENVRRSIPNRPKFYKQVCLNGHDLTRLDRIKFDKKGHRQCMDCAKDHASRERRKYGARERGTFIPRHHTSITETQVIEIITLYNTGHFSQAELGQRFGVSQTSVGRYVRGDRYADLQKSR